MKLIKPSVEILENYLEQVDYIPTKEEILDNIFQQIEVVDRICYKSEDEITEDSSKAFVQTLINRDYGAMLEHGTVYLKTFSWYDRKWKNSPYSKIKVINYDVIGKNTEAFITTNYSVILENNWLDDLQYICLPTEHHEKRVSVRFICDRGVSYELVRHRTFSFAQECVSGDADHNLTRYCNYSEDEHGEEIAFIIPCWTNLKEDTCYYTDSISGWGYTKDSGFKEILNKEQSFMDSLSQARGSYFKLLELGWHPQQARAVLPNALKTEVVMTGFVSDWEQFFKLRTKPDCHPQMLELTIPLKQMFVQRRYFE